jgi:hypothetical protein
MTRISTNYLCTVTDLKDKRITGAKQECRVQNAYRRARELAGVEPPAYDMYGRTDEAYYKRLRVVVRGRLGKHNKHAHLYRVGGEHWRPSSMDIRPEHATRFDVYLADTVVRRKRAVSK